jgi:hypothetical protein
MLECLRRKVEAHALGACAKGDARDESLSIAKDALTIAKDANRIASEDLSAARFNGRWAMWAAIIAMCSSVPPPKTKCMHSSFHGSKSPPPPGVVAASSIAVMCSVCTVGFARAPTLAKKHQTIERLINRLCAADFACRERHRLGARRNPGSSSTP